MSEYGPEFFRNYLDRLDERLMTSEVVAPGAAGRAAGRADAERRDKSIEKNYKNDFLDKFYGTDREPETLCPPGTKSARCGSGNIDYKNFRPPEDRYLPRIYQNQKIGEDAVADAEQIEAAIQQIIDMVSEADIDEDAKDNTMRSLEQAISDLYDV